MKVTGLVKLEDFTIAVSQFGMFRGGSGLRESFRLNMTDRYERKNAETQRLTKIAV